MDPFWILWKKGAIAVIHAHHGSGPRSNEFFLEGERMRRPGFAAPLLLSALLAACAHQNAPVPALTPTPAAAPSTASADAREGNVAVEFLADPDSPRPKLDESQEFRPASSRSTPLPEYPPEALAGGGPSGVVAVRLVLEGGAVRDVKDSPKLARYTGPFAREFRAAVETAVRRWIFTSARIDTLGPARPDMPQRPLMATRYVPTFLDFAFRFSVVDGRGVVSVGSEAPVAVPSTPPERVR
jgi:hypothetical protein